MALLAFPSVLRLARVAYQPANGDLYGLKKKKICVVSKAEPEEKSLVIPSNES